MDSEPSSAPHPDIVPFTFAESTSAPTKKQGMARGSKYTSATSAKHPSPSSTPAGAYHWLSKSLGSSRSHAAEPIRTGSVQCAYPVPPPDSPHPDHVGPPPGLPPMRTSATSTACRAPSGISVPGEISGQRVPPPPPPGQYGRWSLARSTNSGRFLSPRLVDAVDASEKLPRPWFCGVAFVACCAVFIAEVAENGWAVQPLTCPAQCDGGACFEDGRPCESNLMLGPTMRVMDRMGAKDDAAIFDEGEWWRIFTCNWLHAGLFHLLFNMLVRCHAMLLSIASHGIARYHLLFNILVRCHAGRR